MRKLNKLVALIALSLMVSAAVFGNGKKEEKSVSGDELLKIDFFCKPANYQGIQGGWFGKLINDKFNMQVNIIAPNIAGGGQTLYQTRTATGFLGDLVVVSKNELADLVKVGLVLDLTEYYANSTYLKQYDVAVEGMKEFLNTDKVYGIPTRASLRDPLTPKTFGTQPSIGNFMRFDYYQEIGAPTLNNDDDLLKALRAMQDAHPTTETGARIYAISLFKDWDSIYMKYPITMVSNYGYDAGKEGSSFILMNADVSKTESVVTDNGVYHNILKFLNKAHSMGLVDPDSSSNTWNILTEKTRNGQVLWSMWPWASISQFNTGDYADQGIGFSHVPVKSHRILATGVNPYGHDGNVFAIGSKTKDPKRVFEFLDWLGSPEYMEARNVGIRGYRWDVIDGYSQFTELGKKINADTQNALAPEEIGGGNYFGGSPQFNTAVGDDSDINPNTGEAYSAEDWEFLITQDRRKIHEDWTKRFNSQHPVSYLKENNLLQVAPGNSFSPPADSSDIAVKRGMCGDAIVTASWKMVFARNQAEFDGIWEALKADLKGFGFEDVLKVDMKNVEGFKAARAKVLNK